MNDDTEEETRLIEEKFPSKPILFDSNGLELVEGDKVIIIRSDDTYHNTEVELDHVYGVNRKKLYVLGIEMFCDDVTGKIDDVWKVYKLATK